MSHNNKLQLFICSADGMVGHAIAHHLLASKQDRECFKRISVGTTNPQRTEDLAQEGANVVKYNPQDKNNLTESFREHQVVLIIPAHGVENKIEAAKMMIDAAQEAGVKGVFLPSICNAEKCHEEVMKKFVELEKHLERSKIPCRVVLRLSLLMQYFFSFSRHIQENRELALATKKHKFAPLSLRDVACFMVALLKKERGLLESLLAENMREEPEDKKMKMYNLTGPEVLTGEEVAQRVSRAVGTEIHFKDMPLEEIEHMLHESGKLDEVDIKIVMAKFKMIQNGHLCDLSDDYEKIVGKKGETVDEFFKNHSRQFRPQH